MQYLAHVSYPGKFSFSTGSCSLHEEELGQQRRYSMFDATLTAKVAGVHQNRSPTYLWLSPLGIASAYSVGVVCYLFAD